MKNQQELDKQERLKQIYTLFKTAMKPFPVACKKKCATCCTCNVTMTGLEAQLILNNLAEEQKTFVAERIARHQPESMFRPQMTTNGFARALMEGKAVSDEENDPAWGSCPLLVDYECSIYDVRPLGCRAMMSDIACEKQGYATMPDLALTVNALFQQTVEHLDAGGVFGNLCDVIGAELKTQEKDLLAGRGLLKNETITILMVPGEHQAKVLGMVRQLKRLIQ